MGSQSIVLSPRQFKALLAGRNAEPFGMAKQRKEITRTWATLTEEELTPERTKAFDAAVKSGLCMCGCGAKAAKDGRGLAPKCSNQFKGNKAMVHAELGAEEAIEWDRNQQLELKVLPPGWGRDKNDFAKSRKEFIAARKKAIKPERKAVKS
jgi:hypothetical protein